MCSSEKVNSNAFMKFYMLKMLMEYWKGSGAGSKVI